MLSVLSSISKEALPFRDTANAESVIKHRLLGRKYNVMMVNRELYHRTRCHASNMPAVPVIRALYMQGMNRQRFS